MRKNFLRDQAGVSAILFAMMAPVICMFVAFGVDVSTFYLQKRQLQAATDLAAIAAAENPSSALTAAQANLVANGYASEAVQSAVVGVYTASATLPNSQRFTAASVGNAVQVSTQIQAPFYFANIMSMMSSPSSTTSTPGSCPAGGCKIQSGSTGGFTTITATATAAYNAQAAFAVSSGLASLNGGIENAILGGLLGANVSLSLMDYQSLANANIDLFAFSNALATHANLTALTYNQLANVQFSAGAVLSALATAAQASPNAALSVVDDLTTLAGLAPNTTISIGSLVSFGQYGTLLVNSPEPFAVTADALDMVSAIAQLANGTHQVQAALAVNLAPIASASLLLTIGERPVGTSFVTVGAEGATAYTAQTRLLLTLNIGMTGSTSLINLPILIEIAAASAKLTNVSCNINPQLNSATLAVTPAVIDAWIGAVSPSDMTNYSTAPNPGPATLLTVPGVATVTGAANATITNLSPTNVTFSYADIEGAVRQTTSTQDFVSSLLYNLFQNLQLNVNVLGLGISLPSGLTSSIATTLSGATLPIDQLLDQVLAAVGLSVGNAYTWVSGVNCNSAKLVL